MTNKTILVVALAVAVLVLLGAKAHVRSGGVPTTTQMRGPIPPAEYQKMLGTGIDVDWVHFDVNYDRVARDFKSRGFDTVRLRIKDCNTSQQYLAHIKTVVDAALGAGLVPVVSFSASSLKEHPDANTIRCTVRFWTALAKILRNEPYSVSYDLIIEPSEGLNECNTLNAFYRRAVSKIRSIDPYRIIFLAPPERSSPYELNCLWIPRDPYVMVEWHFYAAGPSKTGPRNKWTTGTPAEKNTILRAIRAAKQWQDATGIRTWVGAWMPGNYNHGNDYSVPEQVQFARFMACALRTAGIPFAINAGKHFYDYKSYSWIPKMAPVVTTVLTACKQSD